MAVFRRSSLFRRPIQSQYFGADAVSGSKLYSGIFKTDCKDVVTPDSQVGYDEIVTEIIDIQNSISSQSIRSSISRQF